jgi:hypothetical protein
VFPPAAVAAAAAAAQAQEKLDKFPPIPDHSAEVQELLGQQQELREQVRSQGQGQGEGVEVAGNVGGGLKGFGLGAGCWVTD